MVGSAQAFCCLAVLSGSAFLFLVCTIPFPGKIGISNAASLFQRNTIVKGGGAAVVSASNGGFRRRTRADNSDFPFFSSQEPLTSSTFSQTEPQEFAERYQKENEEEPVDMSSESLSKRLAQGASDMKSIEITEAVFSDAQEKSNIRPLSKLPFMGRWVRHSGVQILMYPKYIPVLRSVSSCPSVP
ncbi:MAG: hypothetical protein ACRCYZ_02110 [Alphaproteobacteria bacterium]